jgi:hypothetical protein
MCDAYDFIMGLLCLVNRFHRFVINHSLSMCSLTTVNGRFPIYTIPQLVIVLGRNGPRVRSFMGFVGHGRGAIDSGCYSTNDIHDGV